eukprot:7135373-Pyramimonas_sp.AAC.1
MRCAAGRSVLVGEAVSELDFVKQLNGRKVPVPLDTGGALYCTFYVAESDAEMVVPSGILLPNGLASESEQHANAVHSRHMQPTHVTRFGKVGSGPR